MGIFTRVRDIVNANINSALDKAEDPEKLVKQMIREMEDTLVEIKAACAGAMAGQRKTEREASRAESRAAFWATRAELAVDRGRENLAREALLTKRRFEEDAEVILEEGDKMGALVAEYKDDIIQIEDKLGTARERQRVLVQRHIHAIHKRRAQREIRRLDTSGAIVRFEEFTQRVDRAESEAELENFGRPKPYSLDAEFRSIEQDEEIEAELKSLKERKQKRQQQQSSNEAIMA